MDVSSTGLRVLQQIAESGSFTAAAARLGYMQSAVSRQAASLEREAGASPGFERRSDGARLTPAGLTLLRHARTILDTLTAAERDLTGTAPRTEAVRRGLPQRGLGGPAGHTGAARRVRSAPSRPSRAPRPA
ncbi:LysR family transcriptional regulator [Streptomyces nigra]|uniref:LysR family transcriptional regulator n=1 Tax=Streptomyces nigra TaxID=1827580 RepID=UPI0036C8182E